jgi:uncharacterized protein involved in exopolysaccharide biosynthesis
MWCFSRHKKKIAACILLMTVIAVTVIFSWPRKYRSEAKLFVHVGRETVTLDPTATTGQIIPIALSRDTEVNSVLEMLRSRAIVEKLVDELGPDTVLKATGAAAASGEESALAKITAAVDPDPLDDRERAIIRATRSLSSAVERKSDVITIGGTARSPQLAQQIVAKLLEIYIGEHARMHATAGSQEFFTRQKALLQQNLTDALAKLRDAKNSLGILSIENQRDVLRAEIIAAETKLAQSQAAVAASRQKTESLHQKLETLPEKLVIAEINGVPSSAADTMRQELYLLEVREAELASRFKDGYPALVAVRAQIEAAKQPLAGEEHRRSQETTGINSVRDQLHVAFLTEESNRASFEAETQSLAKSLADLRDRARLLNEHELQISKLDQEVALAKSNYTTYSEKSEQSRIDEALQSKRITNVNVIQPASLITKPVSPQKTLVLAFGFVAGVALGIASALFSEYRGPAIPMPLQVREPPASPVSRASPLTPVADNGVCVE